MASSSDPIRLGDPPEASGSPASGRILSARQLAAYLGRSPRWLRRHAANLYNAGFPRPLPFLNGYDKEAVDRWLGGFSAPLEAAPDVQAAGPADRAAEAGAGLGAAAALGNEPDLAKIHIRYLVQKKFKKGIDYYWQPSAELRAAGFRPQRLADDIETAIRQAENLNRQVDDWRKGAEPTQCDFHTLPWLIQLYRTDERFTALKLNTKSSYSYCFPKIEAWSKSAGHPPLRLIDRKAVRALYQSLAETPAMANAVLRVLRLLLQFAVDEGYLPRNPASKSRLAATPPRQTIWTDTHVAGFVAAAKQADRRSIALAVLMGIYLGQRQGDILGMTWSQFDGTAITVRQGKTGAIVRVPVVRELALALGEAPHLAPTIVVAETTGRPYRANHFQHEFRRIADAAGLSAYQFLDLRRSAVVRLAEAGCTTAEIAAITGHRLERTMQILETYLPRTSPMAEAAIRKLELHKERTKLDES